MHLLESFERPQSLLTPAEAGSFFSDESDGLLVVFVFAAASFSAGGSFFSKIFDFGFVPGGPLVVLSRSRNSNVTWRDGGVCADLYMGGLCRYIHGDEVETRCMENVASIHHLLRSISSVSISDRTEKSRRIFCLDRRERLPTS